ncbi:MULTISPECIES: hypothetical protein [unclassified Pseudoalteromonas]|uniref:hypothetical protein n=1 Tax=unclassified Pseudoalteromonas TaxID=194690 RepID=UPI0020978EB2|nr:hypothetical protein [Pseudoalteromonas sp. XMcav2-N]MCO7187579.1 hypothetical protein [Pseudoalteromonas sp. XMcav2-N]
MLSGKYLLPGISTLLLSGCVFVPQTEVSFDEYCGVYKESTSIEMAPRAASNLIFHELELAGGLALVLSNGIVNAQQQQAYKEACLANGIDIDAEARLSPDSAKTQLQASQYCDNQTSDLCEIERRR